MQISDNIRMGKPTPDDREFLFYEKLRERCPELGEESARALGAIWGVERKLIIDRMLELSEQAIGNSLHINARPAAILEMAKLNLALIEKMVEWKVSHAGDGALDLKKERAATQTEITRQRIEQTAVILAEEIWNKKMVWLRKCWPLVVDCSANARARRPICNPAKRASHVRKNHYSPVFCNRFWAGSDGMIRIYRRDVAGGIACVMKHYKQWGAEEFLYSNRLEAYLGLVDDDGASSQRKLISTQPLTELDKRRWIAFLVIQLIRTPSSLRQMAEGLRQMLPGIAPAYPTDSRSLKAAYETLFQNNDLYAHFHNLMAPRKWTILHAPAGASFVRADNPVMIRCSSSDATWRLVYPMTPSSLFMVGPEMGGGYEADFVPSRTISKMECADMNRRLAASAAASVIASPEYDDAELRKLLARFMGTRSITNTSHDDGLWGPLI